MSLPLHTILFTKRPFLAAMIDLLGDVTTVTPSRKSTISLKKYTLCNSESTQR